MHMYGFHGVLRGNYFEGEQIRIPEVEVVVVQLINGKDLGRDEVTRDGKR